MASKPSVIILGGVGTYSRALAAFLVPIHGEPLVSHLRIVDKYSVKPPTTYLGSEFPEILKNPIVEYKQMNLTVAAKVTESFEPPEGQPPYSYVFDYTGDVSWNRGDALQVEKTCHITYLIGQEAARRGVKGFVRLLFPGIETEGNGPVDESAKVHSLSNTGAWWWETQRILAAIPDLPAVVLRVGFAYGPYMLFGKVALAMVVAACYGHMGQPMKSLGSPGKHGSNTVHVEDIASAMWECAKWIDPLGRKKADELAGEKVIFLGDKKVAKDIAAWLPPPDKDFTLPVFHLADDSNHTLLSLGQLLTGCFGTTFEFYNLVTSTMAKFKMEDAVEEINEHHVSAWTEMITTSTPPIPNTPLSAYMEGYQIAKHQLWLKNDKIKRVVGYKLKRPVFGKAEVMEVVEKWTAEGTWPNVIKA